MLTPSSGRNACPSSTSYNSLVFVRAVVAWQSHWTVPAVGAKTSYNEASTAKTSCAFLRYHVRCQSSGRKCEVLQVGWYQWSVLKVCARRRAGRHRTFRLYCRCFVVGRFHPNISVWNVSSDVISVTRRFGQCTRYLQTKVRLLFDHYPHFTLSFLTGQYGIGYTQRRGLGKDLGWFVQEVEVDASRGTGLSCGSWLPGLWVHGSCPEQCIRLLVAP